MLPIAIGWRLGRPESELGRARSPRRIPALNALLFFCEWLPLDFEVVGQCAPIAVRAEGAREREGTLLDHLSSEDFTADNVLHYSVNVGIVGGDGTSITGFERNHRSKPRAFVSCLVRGASPANAWSQFGPPGSNR